MDKLKHEARNGSADAACRLAVEYDSCAFIDGQLASFGIGIAQASMAGDQAPSEVAVSFARDREKQLLAKAAHCEGVSIPSSAARIGYWRQAARAGNIAAMTAYSTGAVFRPYELMENLDSLQVYRGEAVGMAKHAAERGSPDAILALAIAYDPNERYAARGSLLAQLVEPDPVEAMAMYELYRNSLLRSNPAYEMQLKRVDTRVSVLASQLSSAQQAEAKLEAENRKGTWAPLQVRAGYTVNATQPALVDASSSEFCTAR